MDAATGAVLDTRSVTSFSSGKWMVWNVRGHVRMRVTQTGSGNALVAGIFFGAATTTGGGTASVPRDGHQALAYDQSSNRITTSGFEYDAAGNQTRMKRADGQWQRMSYDAANRLVEVKNDANTVTYESYRYGVGNQRITSEAGGLRTYYAGGGGQASVEYTQAVSGGGVLHWSKSYIYAGGSVLATITPAGASEYVEYHHPDRLGTRLISNNQNVNVQEQETLPFGAALSSGSSTRQFTSYDRSSATGLDYAVNRRYDSLQGRFTQVDPIGAGASSLTDPQSWNMYAYCGNDPVNHTDPDGLFFKKLGRWFKKHWKAILLIAVIVAIAIIATPGAAGFLKGLFVKAGWKMGFLSKSFVADKAVYGLSGLGKGLLGSAAGGLVGRLAQEQKGREVGENEEIEVSNTRCPAGTLPAGKLCPGSYPTPSGSSTGTILAGGVFAVGLALPPAWVLYGTLGAITLFLAYRAYQNAPPLSDQNIFARGNRDVQKINQGRADAAKEAIDKLKVELEKLKSTPNKTPEIKEQLERVARDLNRQVDRLRKSETHGRKGKGN